MKTPRVTDFDPNAKPPVLGSPFVDMPRILAPKEKLPAPEERDNKPVSQQTSLHANLQTGKDASMQTRKPASLQVGKHVNLQTGKQVIIEKYSSYLTHEYKRELKRIAFETDRNEYEVLLEAMEHYLEKQKHPK